MLVSFGEDAEAETISLETGVAFALEFVDSCELLVLLAPFGLRVPCFAKPVTRLVQDPVGVRAMLLLAC